MNPHRQRCLEGYSPWGCKDWVVTDLLSTAQHTGSSSTLGALLYQGRVGVCTLLYQGRVGVCTLLYQGRVGVCTLLYQGRVGFCTLPSARWAAGWRDRTVPAKCGTGWVLIYGPDPHGPQTNTCALALGGAQRKGCEMACFESEATRK